VFNVAHAVLKACYSDRPPFRLFEIHTGAQDDHAVTPISDHAFARRATDRPVPDTKAASK
jgi:hypothetical protein